LLGVASAGETPTADESTEALEVLNQMLDQWSNERLMIYEVINNLFTITAGTSTYTMGPANSGAVWESSQITRPLLIQRQAAFIRDENSGLATDYKIEYYPNDRFQELLQKTVTTNYPYIWTCDWVYPISNVRIYPTPTINLKFGLTEWAQLKKFCDLSTYCDMPPGYEMALSYNLALHLSPEYGVEPNAIVVDQARETKYNIKRTNQQPVLIGCDSALVGKGPYDIYSDLA
jgi:hypothetical protein